MRTARVLLVLGVIVAFFVPLPARAQDDDSPEKRSRVTINGRTIEVVGSGASVQVTDDGVVIRSGKRTVRVSPGKLFVGDNPTDLPEYRTLKLDLRKNRVWVDDREVADLGAALEEAEEALDEAGRAVDEAGKALDEAAKALEWERRGKDDEADEDDDETDGDVEEASFPLEEVKKVALRGLTRAFRIETDARAKKVTVRRAGPARTLARVSVTLDEGILSVEPSSGVEPQPRILVVMPPSMPLSIRECRGGSVGELSDALQIAQSGVGDVTIGKVGSADVEVMGSGDVEIASVEGGDLRIAVGGSGSVIVGGGTAKKGELTISGTGDILCRAVIAKATLSVTGTGTIQVVAPKEIVRKSVTGTGEIEILKE